MIGLRELRVRCGLVVDALLASASAADAEVTRVDDRQPRRRRHFRLRKDRRHDSLRRRSRRIRTTASSSISTRRRVNAAGRVEFSSDLYILRPKAPRGNGAALVDVLNRGNKVVLTGVQPRRVARSGDRQRSWRSLPDAVRIHAGRGSAGSSMWPTGPGDAHSRAGGDRAAASRSRASSARRWTRERSRRRFVAARSRELRAGRS